MIKSIGLFLQSCVHAAPTADLLLAKALQAGRQAGRLAGWHIQ